MAAFNMDHHIKEHLRILNSRVISLERELKAALRDSRVASDRKRLLEEGLQTAESNRAERIQSLECKYGAEIDEYTKQICLAEEVLVRKKEERRAMLEYLSGLDLVERNHNELRDFDWSSLQRLTENINKPSEEVLEKYNKLEDINELSEIARKQLDNIHEQISSTEIVRERLKNVVCEFEKNLGEWKILEEQQEKRISKIQTDNEKINLLLRQCVASNEPLSEFVTKTVQAKCQSFVNCDPNSSELLDGLRKFKARQDKIIKLLRHKEAKLGSETNKLQVACDQTQDQLKFYNQIVEQHRNTILNRGLAQ